MAGGITNRVAVQNLTAPQVTDLRSALGQMMQISDNRGFQYLAGLHGIPGLYCWHHQQNSRTRRRMQLFLPWHRAYLYNFELAMRDRVPNVSLSWWDWTLGPPRQHGIPVIFSEGGQQNPLTGFRMNLPNTRPPLTRRTSRHPGDPGDLPKQGDVEACLKLSDWHDFNLKIEDLHDQVHGWVSGDMGIVAIAAYDPIFWFHHTMIDRLWSMWQIRNGAGNIPPDLLDVVLSPFNMKVSDVLSINALGYDYAAAQSSIDIGGPG
jgi:tyrosinase